MVRWAGRYAPFAECVACCSGRPVKLRPVPRHIAVLRELLAEDRAAGLSFGAAWPEDARIAAAGNEVRRDELEAMRAVWQQFYYGYDPTLAADVPAGERESMLLVA